MKNSSIKLWKRRRPKGESSSEGDEQEAGGKWNWQEIGAFVKTSWPVRRLDGTIAVNVPGSEEAMEESKFD